MTGKRRKIHIKSKIIFNDPHVFRIAFPDECPIVDHKNLVRNIRNFSSNTWGYTNVEHEWSEPHAYFCFEDSQDVLQFRLAIKYDIKPITIWESSLKFTIYEYQHLK